VEGTPPTTQARILCFFVLSSHRLGRPFSRVRTKIRVFSNLLPSFAESWAERVGPWRGPGVAAPARPPNGVPGAQKVGGLLLGPRITLKFADDMCRSVAATRSGVPAATRMAVRARERAFQVRMPTAKPDVATAATSVTI
jgi:hypothetical protein